tara:strand:+ start:7964 stop:8386 length:423 start_codon:yes stop_codon:yes gene_type:complete
MKEQKKEVIFFGDVGSVEIKRLDIKTTETDRVLSLCFTSQNAPTIIEILDICENHVQAQEQNEKMIRAILKSFGFVDDLVMLVGSTTTRRQRKTVQIDACVSVPDFTEFKTTDPVVDINNPKSINAKIDELLNETNISRQ